MNHESSTEWSSELLDMVENAHVGIQNATINRTSKSCKNGLSVAVKNRVVELFSGRPRYTVLRGLYGS